MYMNCVVSSVVNEICSNICHSFPLNESIGKQKTYLKDLF